MIDKLLTKENLNQAYLKVYRNKGVGGIDKLQVEDLKEYLSTHGSDIQQQIRNGSYQAAPIRGIYIPKDNGKKRLLGIPTVTDRFVQQALLQVLSPIFEADFQTHSYGFRPNRSAHQALEQSLKNIKDMLISSILTGRISSTKSDTTSYSN